MINHDPARPHALSLVQFLTAVTTAVLFASICPTSLWYSSTMASSQQTRDTVVNGSVQYSSPYRGGKELSDVWVPRDFTFRNEGVRDAIDRTARSIRLNVVYHSSSLQFVDNTNADLTLEKVSAPAAIDALLHRYGLAHVRIDQRTIMIVREGTRGSAFKQVVAVISEAEAAEAEEKGRGNQAADELPRALRRHDAVFKNASLAGVIEHLAGAARLSIMFDSAIEARVKVNFVTVELRDVTAAQALRYILDAYDLKYEEINGYTLNIVDQRHEHSSTPLEEIIKRLQ
jgi:hypothetical protein